MRGKLPMTAHKISTTRITPADAGKTRQQKTAPPAGQDHPRGCGENFHFVSPSVFFEGSPPRMRGKLYVVNETSANVGITPADAGKTLQIITFYPRKQDHPRGCGENRITQKDKWTVKGSPPRMRGKRATPTAPIYHGRITPADAGKTCSR